MRQDDENEKTEFEEVEVERRPAHSKMRSKIKWKQSLLPTKIETKTTTASEGSSTGSSSSGSVVSDSSMISSPSINLPIMLKPDVSSQSSMMLKPEMSMMLKPDVSLHANLLIKKQMNKKNFTTSKIRSYK